MIQRHTEKEPFDARNGRIRPIIDQEVSLEELSELVLSEFCLPVIEEFDIGEYIWFPRITDEELEAFWRNLVIGGDGFWRTEADSFPGTLLCVFDYVTNNKHRNLYDDEGVSAFMEIHQSLYKRPSTYHAHFCCNRDSHLITPDWRAIFHKSHTNEEGRKSVIAWAAHCKANNYTYHTSGLHPTINPDRCKIRELINLSDQKAAKWLQDLNTGDFWYWPASWITHDNMAAELNIQDYDKGIMVDC